MKFSSIIILKLHHEFKSSLQEHTCQKFNTVGPNRRQHILARDLTVYYTNV
jgi:hypothetical protein